MKTKAEDKGSAWLEAAGGHITRTYWAEAWHRLSRDRVAMVCLGIVLFYVALAVLPSFTRLACDYAEKDYDHRYQPPSAEHWLGTDIFGRDVLSRVIYGARISMWVGLMSNVLGIPLGVLMGVLGGYFGRRVDDAVVYVYTTVASIPGILMLMALAYALQGKTVAGIQLSGINGVILALGLTGWVGTCRYVRGETLRIKESDYVTAARALGAGPPRIIFRHIIPNLLHLVIIIFSLSFVYAIQAEVILSYLGLGAQPGTPSWGDMINGARTDLLLGRWWELTGACGALFVVVLALNILGDSLRDALDPRLRGTM